MKKFFPLVFALLVLASCEKDPDLGKVQNDIATYTEYDKSANFGSATSFYVPAEIKIATDDGTEETNTSAGAIAIVNTVISEMTSRGYTEAASQDVADLGIQLSYIATTHYFTYGNYGWGFPGYWNHGYWGNWNSWYYPYVSVFNYTNGSLVVQMLDLKKSGATSTDLTVIWEALTIGLLQNSDAVNQANAIAGVKQAFKQSPYIKATDSK